MLFRKMLREFKSNFGLFFSIFLLSALAIAMFCTMEGHVLSQNAAREKYHEECNLSDLWMYGEGFTQDELDEIRALDFVEAAQLRMSVTGTTPEFAGVQVDMFLERENVVNTPYLVKGEEFNPEDTEGIWLANAFAVRRNLDVGDDFTIEYNGVTFTKKIKGLVESTEYEYRQADGDADVYLENIAIVFMSYDAFPIRDYVTHLIESEKITARKIADNTKILDEKLEQLKTAGLTVDDITRDMLLEIAENMSDEKLAKLMPYTQMIIRTKDGGALAHEDEVAKAIDYDYSAIIDRKSIQGIVRLDSELEQHQAFAYVFVVIFVGIAVLVIATSMGRIVEKQRTQIGTMNALGMKRWKIVLHYISYSLLVSMLGVVVGLIFGVGLGAPAMMSMFEQYYIVPGLHSVFHPLYIIISLAIIAVCSLSCFLSCRKVLGIKPAEALRPAAPKQGKKCIFEKLPFWEKLSFNTQYNLRDISRAKLRAFMGIVGTAVGMLLMLYGVGCNQLVDIMTDLNFNKIYTTEYQVKLSADAKLVDVDELSDSFAGELVMTDAVEISKVKNASSSEKKKEIVTVIEEKGLYNLIDVNNEITQLVPGTVGISRKLAEDMGIKVGDTIYWHIYSKNEWHEAVVGSIYRSCESQGIAYLRDDYEKTGAEYTPTLLMTDDESAHDASTLKYVTSVNSRSDMIAAYEKSMEVVNIMVYMMVIFSTVMIVVVLYNSGSLSFNERVKELATLKVMGLQSSQIRHLLTVQNIWLSVIGIIIGTPLGNISLNAMMNSNGENFDYSLSVPVIDYIISGILVLVVSVLVSFMFSSRIKKLDLVETLKGVE
ncbi:efflux ABC transporter permease protein [Firmicutes bacterium CAG:882]|nr:efflux ABC transporter permease protein [Firmicutes bacterium CAG:882]